MKQDSIKFDIMLNGRYKGTLRMPITLDIIEDYVGDMPVVGEDSFRRFIEEKLPTLKGKPYTIAPCGKPQFVDRGRRAI